MDIYDSIDSLPNTSSITIRKLKLLEIATYFDLLQYFPSRYENFSLISPIDRLQEGEIVTVKGKVVESKNVYTKRGITLQKVILADETGQTEIVWYNQPYLVKTFSPGTTLAVAGLVKKFLSTFTLEPKEYEILRYPEQPTIHTGRLVPIYPEKKGISTKTVREKIFKAILLLKNGSPDKKLHNLEWLPQVLIDFNALTSLEEALELVHFPTSPATAENARSRLAFDELFTMQLSSALVKEQWKKDTVSLPFEITRFKSEIDTFIQNLPFKLTAAQERVYGEILSDLLKKNPMNRFLQGDVGSGKTVVAAIGAYISFLNGYQTLLMAPTEILAHQHFATISKLFESYKITIGLQTGSKKSLHRHPDILIGTHALLTESVSLEKIGLVVIDEQHRFGVAQRAKLKQKGMNPHLLTMTATPIPRTIALTLYGELDLSVIDEFPAGRLPIKTFLTPKTKRDDAYAWIKTQIAEHKTQVFIICPLIEESETETLSSVRAAKKEYEFLKNTVFKNENVGLLHGRMKGKEKEAMMRDFKDKKYDILVSTSVVEVGIDVPNATIMVIEGAERYGLAQLHQLRGRVGRGEKQSYCLLFTSEGDEKMNSRLKFFASTLSGIRLAEFDYKIRGPGAMFGTKQHGYLDLKIADLSDFQLISKVKNAVQYLLTHYKLEDLPEVKKRVEHYQISQIARD